LPAYIANCSPLFVTKINLLAIPVDLGKKFRGKRIFGSHKTYRGLFIATLSGILVFLLQVWLFNYDSFQRMSIINYDLFFQRYNILPGFLLGFGAIIGDLIKSFFKRQLNVKPGDRWFPWDQIDFMIGSLLFFSFISILKWQAYVVIVIATPIIHITSNYLGYYLKIKKVKW
ncbi:MAG: CDP-2,3-bis-(O-geranylgeranyl)-sn-glycerol synthase, partial [Candidatus Woesearchaeota archaeon]|nr:CDP-2,3-bis-(O-geranylgeranyl)-sn-glycerol synthase [Candidatus Woesearchaeota archaeon]